MNLSWHTGQLLILGAHLRQVATCLQGINTADISSLQQTLHNVGSTGTGLWEELHGNWLRPPFFKLSTINNFVAW